MRAALRLAVMALAAWPIALRAQQPASSAPAPATQDTALPLGPGMVAGDTARMRELRQRVEQVFGQMVRQQLELNDQQMQQLRATMRAHQDRQRDLARRQQEIQQGMRRQMQPGIAADTVVLKQLVEAEGRLRLERVQQEEQLERELTFLDPVRRARFLQMYRRFQDQVQDIRRHMQEQRQMEMQRPMQPRPWLGTPGARPNRPNRRP